MSEQIKQWLLSGLLVVGIGGVACGSSSSSDNSPSGDKSGVTQSKMLGELSAGEKTTLCEWSIKQMKADGSGAIDCNGTTKQTSTTDECLSSEYFAPGTCATVEQFEACVNAYGADPCQALPAECETFYNALMDKTNSACQPKNGIAPGCETVQLKCFCYDTPDHVSTFTAQQLDALSGVGDICAPPPMLAGTACFPCTSADRLAAIQACAWDLEFPPPPPPDPVSPPPPTNPYNFPPDDLKCWYIPGLEALCNDCLATGKVRTDCTKCNQLDATYAKFAIKDKKKDKCKDDDKDLTKEFKNCKSIPGLEKLCKQCTDAGNARTDCRACENYDRITQHWKDKGKTCEQDNPEPCPADTCCEPVGQPLDQPTCPPPGPVPPDPCAVNPNTPECCPECWVYVCPITRMRYGYSFAQ